MKKPNKRPWWKKRRVHIAALGAVVLGIVFLVPDTVPPKDLRGLLADHFGVEEENLFVNLPPRPSRYPGSVLLELGQFPLSLVGRDDADLERGEAFEFRVGYEGRTAASGSVTTAIFDEIGHNSRQVASDLEINEGHVVEIGTLVERLGQAELLRALAESQTPARVIVRAWEGEISVVLERKKETSAELFGEFLAKLEKIADNDSGAKVEFERTEKDRATIQVLEPVVVAFEAADAGALLAAIPRLDPVPVTLENVTFDPESAVDSLIRIDPRSVPALEQALREIGPRAGPLVMSRVLQVDPQSQERAAALLERLPPETQVDLVGAKATLDHADPVVREAGVRYLSRRTSESEQVVELLKRALSDNSPMVRREALVGVLMRGDSTDVAAAVAPLAEDPDP